MKLALVIEKYDPAGGGAERSTRQIAMELIARGHDVTVICAQCPLKEDGHVKIDLLPDSGKLHAARLKRFSQWATSQIQRGCFDASISMTTTVPGTILQPRSGTALETMRRNLAIFDPSTRVIKQAFNALSPKKRTLLSLERRILAAPRDPALRHIAANSHYVARQLAELYNVPSEMITVIPNAACMPACCDAQRTQWRQAVHEGYNISSGEVVFMFAAMNPMLKGLSPLLEAFAKLVSNELPVVLLVAGKFQKRYIDLANKLGIRRQVRFLGPTDEMAKLYAASDVLVHPTYYDPSSKVVIEALMMGIAAISTSFNGASDMITPQDGAVRGRVIVNPSDIDALAHAMTELVDADARRACSDATKGLAKSLSMSVHVDRLIALVEKTIAEV